MSKLMTKVLCVVAGLALVTIIACKPADNVQSSYGEDRAEIENLQARYMFALDFGDLDTFVTTFTEDGILDIIGMKWQGREKIKEGLGSMMPPVGEENPETQEASEVKEEKPLYRATGRHNISNIVLKIDGDTAVGRAYWFHYSNNNPQRTAAFDGYGHYEDEMVKVKGQWLFTKRRIYNEGVEKWASKPGNPCW